jgi:serine/threonine-protein phosphatase PP1-1
MEKFPDLDEPAAPVTFDPVLADRRRARSNTVTELVSPRRSNPRYNNPLPPLEKVDPPKKMGKKKVPQPGPARLKPGSDVDAWLAAAKKNKYLPEHVMKQLFERCKELLMEESNTQPVSTPVTICGDIHGQFYDLLELFRVAGGMPGEEKSEAPTTAVKGISAEDLEPPTSITDPKLQKKMKKLNVGDNTAGSSKEASEDDDAEEVRGRSRTTDLDLKEGNADLPGNQNFIFMGDFVDRGYFSLETLTLLLCLKAR